jgi:hypothetical protein
VVAVVAVRAALVAMSLSPHAIFLALRPVVEAAVAARFFRAEVVRKWVPADMVARGVFAAVGMAEI